MTKQLFFIGVLTICTVVLLIISFNVTGSPFEMQKIGSDTKRLNHFRLLSEKIDAYYYDNSQLPSTLQLVMKTEQDLADPITKQPIGYKTIDQHSYELCTTFATDSEKIKLSTIFYNQETSTMSYRAGYSCVRLRVAENIFRNSVKTSPLPSPVVIIQSPPPTYAVKTETGLYMGKIPIPNSNPTMYLLKIDVSNGRGQRIIDVKEPKGGVRNSNNQLISFDSMNINDTLFFSYTIDTDDQFIATEMIDKSL